jgi:hypothetical protein
VIAVFVTLQYDVEMSPARLRQIAEGSQDLFKGMPGLRSKVYTIDSERRRATNVYLWDDGDKARAFFSEGLRQKVAALYGVEPSIDFADVAALVENR